LQLVKQAAGVSWSGIKNGVHVSSKEKAIGILVLIVLLSLLLYNYADSFAIWAKTGEPVAVSVAYLILTPAYILLLYLLVRTKGPRGFFASLFVITALDILSYPHYVPQAGTMPSDASSYVGLDTILWRSVPNYPLGTIGLYVLTPTLLLVIAYEIVAPGTFVSLVRKVGA